ncbi:MAG: biopolymer transporter ExbB [Verrucomicrobiales bacterium]|nr:biopolymer transporter ExbB [Verrucomicrobiales bacterium]MEC7883212.1 MotA/TolQ/ExbB proton channel family protein [Verrucomicrobiota bacterium]
MHTLILILLGLTSVISLTFIIERGWALRRVTILPNPLLDSLDHCHTRADVNTVLRFAQLHQNTPLARLTTTAIEHLEWAKPDNVEALQTRARHEVSKMERGLIVLEIITGIAPLLGLVGTVVGLIDIFSTMAGGETEATAFAQGISTALWATLSGLSIAIPSLIAWSIYNKRIETFAIEMETQLDVFLRRQYPNSNEN